MKDIEILSTGSMYEPTMEIMAREFTVHKLWQAEDKTALLDNLRAYFSGRPLLTPVD